MARYKTILTNSGSELLTRALAKDEKVNIDSVQMGIGIYEGDKGRINHLVTPVEVNTKMGDREFTEGKDGKPSVLRIGIQTFNNGLTEPTPIREIGLFVDSRLFAYAWQEGEDTDNILPPPLDINIADTIHMHEIGMFVTNQENAGIEVSFAFDGFVSHGYLNKRLANLETVEEIGKELENHIENKKIHVSEEEKKAVYNHTQSKEIHISEDERKFLDDIVESGGLNGTIATSLEDIGLNNTATLTDVITAMRAQQNEKREVLNLDVNTGLTLIANMPITTGTGHLEIERAPKGTNSLLLTYRQSANTGARSFNAATTATGTAITWRETRLSTTQIVLADMASNSVGTTQIANFAVTGEKLQSGIVLPGSPTIATRPATTSNNTQIPDTAWVRARITELGQGSIINGTAMPQSGTAGTGLTWNSINGGSRVRRIGNIVELKIDLLRTGSGNNIPLNFTLPAGFRPDMTRITFPFGFGNNVTSTANGNIAHLMVTSGGAINVSIAPSTASPALHVLATYFAV